MNKTEDVLNRLHKDAEKDPLRMTKKKLTSLFRPLTPNDFEDAYLPISAKQGQSIKELIVDHKCKNIIEFGTSFGISTIYLALGAKTTGGKVTSTELLEGKAKTALRNITEAGLNELVEIKIGDALQTLQKLSEPVDFLFLDGWKDLYLPLFKMLEPLLHSDSIIYADNMDLSLIHI